MERREEEAKHARVFTLDLANNRVVVEKKTPLPLAMDSHSNAQNTVDTSTRLFYNPTLQSQRRPVFLQATKSKDKKKTVKPSLVMDRLQDEVEWS